MTVSLQYSGIMSVKHHSIKIKIEIFSFIDFCFYKWMAILGTVENEMKQWRGMRTSDVFTADSHS